MCIFVPYANSVVSTYKTLTSSIETETNKWFMYYSTAEAQRDGYNGEIVDNIKVEFVEIVRKNDYVLLWTYGDNISSITWTYSYSVNYN